MADTSADLDQADHRQLPPGRAESTTLEPAGHVIECPWCGDGLAHAVTAGKWSNAGDGYADIIYVHRGCPAVDANARTARPQLLAAAPPPRRRRLPLFTTPRSL